MKNITLQISEEELLEVTNAYRVLQTFLDKLVSPNDLYIEEFLGGLVEAQTEKANGELVEVKDFADFVQKTNSTYKPLRTGRSPHAA